MSQVVLAVGTVSDLSPAVAARLAGGKAVPPPPAGPLAACMVDMNRMTSDSTLGQRYARQLKEMEKALQDDGGAKQSRLAAMDSTIAQLRRDLDAQRAVLSPAAADRKSREVEEKVRERETFRESGQRELEQARQKAMSQAQAINTEFQQKVKPHLERAARDRRCDLIFSSQEALALEPERDLTAAAIASLDAGALGASPAPARTPAAPTRLGVLDVQRLLRDSTRARAWRAEAERGSEKAATPEAETARQAALDARVLAQMRPHVDEVARSKHVEMIVAANVVLAIDAGADMTAAVIAEMDAPPPPPPPPAAVRVGGDIKEPRKLKDVRPVYPDVARQARVQGIVILECVIGADGTVTEVKVVRGVPLLDEAAKEAVRQWVYEPTLLNGVPVPVIMTVTASFRLD
jgi:TonB family protein